MAKRIGSLRESRICLWACSTIRDRAARPFARAGCFAEFDPWLRSATRDVLRFSLPAQAGIRGYARSPPEPSGETVNTPAILRDSTRLYGVHRGLHFAENPGSPVGAGGTVNADFLRCC